MAALQRYLQKREITERRQAAEELYRQYFGSYEFYHTSELDDIMRSFDRFPEEERADRLEMLAELYYAEADMLSEPMRTRQLEMAYAIFSFVDRHSRTFSADRLNKIKNIERLTAGK